MKRIRVSLNALFLLLLLLAFTRCSTTVNTTAESTVPKLLFLAYEAKMDTVNGTIAVTLLYQMQQPGSIPEPEDGLVAGPDDWVISFLDDNNEIARKEVIKDPFRQVLEGVNEKGELKKFESRLLRTEVTLRLNLDPQAKKIRIERLEQDKKMNVLFQHPIKP